MNLSKTSSNSWNTHKPRLYYKWSALMSKKFQINKPAPTRQLPAEVCLNFSLFFFLHFHGLKSLPRVANLLLLLIGGVWVPGTRESERIAASLSTSSAVISARKREKNKEGGKWNKCFNKLSENHTDGQKFSRTQRTVTKGKSCSPYYVNIIFFSFSEIVNLL